MLAVDTIGHCWSYTKSKGSWSNINQVLLKENQDSTSENHVPFSVIDICCSDTMHLAVTDKGTNLFT